MLNQITKGHPPFTVEKATKLPVDFFKCRSREVKPNSGDLTKKKEIDESWKQNLNEDKLHIRKNEFVCGVIDKAQFADYGLVHTVHELYGSNAAGNLLSVFSRLFTVFLQVCSRVVDNFIFICYRVLHPESLFLQLSDPRFHLWR